MGVDGGEYSLCRKRSVAFGGHICRAGFLCETARGDFRFGNSIENSARQSRPPLRALARTGTPADCLSVNECGSGLSAAILDRTQKIGVNSCPLVVKDSPT